MQLTIAEMNLAALERISCFLCANPRAITAADVREIAGSCGVDEHEAVYSLLCAYCGIGEDRISQALARYYLKPSLRRLDADEFRANPYYRGIRFPEKRHGRWQLTTLRYKPYEIFVRDDLLRMEDGREIPQLGYFAEEFVYPAVLENGREWMTVTPNEIATMREPLSHMRGNIAVMGLGLGYFAYMASEKPEVSSVVIVERDPEIIDLFTRHILPQFPQRDKISIVQEDAFEFAAVMAHSCPAYDCVFVDLWHDVSDGVGMYLRMKRLQKRLPGTHFEYWIEPSILAWLRSMALEGAIPLLDGDFSDANIRRCAHEIPLEIAPE